MACAVTDLSCVFVNQSAQEWYCRGATATSNEAAGTCHAKRKRRACRPPQGETRVKLPGSVAGQQFIIDGCQDCDFYIMDACAMVTVDDCTNCRIFVGPTRSSIFLRNCAGCSCAFLCRCAVRCVAGQHSLQGHLPVRQLPH